jgi:transaldolase / glucose-6-phosphate isomerase
LSLPSQVVYPGALEGLYGRELDRLVSGQAVPRLWAKDPSLWPSDEQEAKSLKSNLRWLDLPEQIGPYMTRVAEFANSVEAEGFEDAVFVGMGDSNLAAETVAHLSLPKRWKRIFVLDSTNPAEIRAVEREANFEKTLFIFASKSGKRIETHALLLYFMNLLKDRGIAQPGRQFVAVSEENSYLASLAGEYKFRGNFHDPPGISGRYSALIHFGLLFAGLSRLAPASILFPTSSMLELCRHGHLRDSNPALALAALLVAGAAQGNDRFLLFGTTSLAAMTHRVAQLVGVSTSKRRQGLIPICVEVPAMLPAYQHGSVAVLFHMRGDQDSAIKQLATDLKRANVPHVSIELSSPEELGAELFKWEVATALACAMLVVNPFDEPDVHESASRAYEILEKLATKRELPPRTVRVREAGIELYAEGQTRNQISTLNLVESLRTFFQSRPSEGYIGILAFIERKPSLQAVLRRIVGELASKLGIPALLTFGPRYLHNLGQVFLGGPAKGLFMTLTGEASEDLPIPGAGYSFAQLQLALALGDFEALERHHRPVVRLHLTQGADHGLAQLERIVQQALKNIRGAEQ